MQSPKKLRFRIEGMNCAACSSRLERVLSALDNVAVATVNLAAATAEITPAPDLAAEALPALAQAVQERTTTAGFAAFPVSDDADEAAQFAQNEEAARGHVRELRNRLIPEFAFSSLLMLIAMGHMLGMPLPQIIDPMVNPLNNGLVQLLLTLPVMFSGRDFYRKGLPGLMRGAPNMDSLVAVGTGAAFLYSLWNVAAMFPLSGEEHLHARMALSMDLYFESVAVLITLISLGKYFEMASRLHTSDALGALMRLTPETALRRLPAKADPEWYETESYDEVPLSSVVPGDLLQVKPGSRVPVDGVIVHGASAIDASMLTGESMPVEVTTGDAVTGGTLNTTGVFVMRAERVGADTAIARMARMVREAQGSKAPIARMADRVSLYFVPAVMVLALVTGLGWHFFGNVPVGEALRMFVAVLVVACPCALGLATPMSIMVATGRGARLGVLVKTGAALEMAGRLDVLVFDKTGTLTEGRPEIVSITPTSSVSEKECLRLAASLEAVSEHPLAAAVLRAAKGLELAPVSDLRTVPGRGLQALLMPSTPASSTPHGGTPIFLGNLAYMRDNGIPLPPDLPALLESHAAQGHTLLLLATNTSLLALLAAADTLRPESADTIRALQAAGIRTLMLSGDNERTARAVATQAGITEVIADVLPEGKEAVIVNLQSQNLRVGMVGDGVNDAPALARAHVGLVVSSGIDVAIEAGDIVLLSSPNTPALRGVLTAVRLGRSTLRNIRENLFWAFGYNVLLVPIAAGLLKLMGGPGLSPMLAGGAMALSSVSVVLNALRLKNFK